MKSVRRHGKRKGTLANTIRVIIHRPERATHIEGWRKCGPFWIPEKRQSK